MAPRAYFPHPDRPLRRLGQPARRARAHQPFCESAGLADLPPAIMTMVMPMVILPQERFMHTIKASEFKAKCLALMDEVARTGKPVLVTKHGKPVAELRPHRPRPKSALGVWKDQLIVKGDIVSPIDVEWDALK
jgi:prevent-host-death family protein